MRIAIVNDMPLAVEALRRALAFEPAHQVVWVASDGEEAVRLCAGPDAALGDLAHALDRQLAALGHAGDELFVDAVH